MCPDGSRGRGQAGRSTAAASCAVADRLAACRARTDPRRSRTVTRRRDRILRLVGLRTARPRTEGERAGEKPGAPRTLRPLRRAEQLWRRLPDPQGRHAEPRTHRDGPRVAVRGAAPRRDLVGRRRRRRRGLDRPVHEVLPQADRPRRPGAPPLRGRQLLRPRRPGPAGRPGPAARRRRGDRRGTRGARPDPAPRARRPDRRERHPARGAPLPAPHPAVGLRPAARAWTTREFDQARPPLPAGDRGPRLHRARISRGSTRSRSPRATRC